MYILKLSLQYSPKAKKEKITHQIAFFMPLYSSHFFFHIVEIYLDHVAFQNLFFLNERKPVFFSKKSTLDQKQFEIKKNSSKNKNTNKKIQRQVRIFFYYIKRKLRVKQTHLHRHICFNKDIFVKNLKSYIFFLLL